MRRALLKAGVTGLTMLVVVSVMGVAAAPASADVFCVPNNSINASCQTPEPGIQAALTAAQNLAGNNTVRIGPGTYPTTTPGGFVWAGANGDLSIIGAGQGATKITVTPPATDPPSFTQYFGFYMQGIQNSHISDLTVTLPTPALPNIQQQYYGISQSRNGDTIDRVTVNSTGNDATNGYGMAVAASTISNSTADFPPTGQMVAIGSNASATVGTTVRDSTARGSYGILLANSNQAAVSSVIRSRVTGQFGISAVTSVVDVQDTSVNLASLPFAIGLDVGFGNPAPHTSTLTADGVTISGSDPSQLGVRVTTPDAQGGDEASADLKNTIITAPLIPARVVSNATAAASTSSLTGDYSNFDNTQVTQQGAAMGTTSVILDHQTNLDPGLTPDLHLLPTSPLIDIGDPIAPAQSRRDFDGDDRAVAKICGGVTLRDIGADEYAPDCIAPQTTITIKPKPKLKVKKRKRARASFAFKSSEAGSTFTCSLDGAPFAACKSPAVFRLRRGIHTFLVRAKDAAGNVDATPASAGLRVVTKKKKKHHKR